MKKLNRRLAIAACVILCIMIGVWAFSMSHNNEPFERTLSSPLIPTAQFLLQHPQPVPAFIDVIAPSIASTITSSTQICVAFLPPMLSKEHVSDEDDTIIRNFVLDNTEFVLNNKPISTQKLDTQILDIAKL